MKGCKEIVYLLTGPYRAISKGSIVNVEGEQFEIKRVIEVILLEREVTERPTVRIKAWAMKSE